MYIQTILEYLHIQMSMVHQNSSAGDYPLSLTMVATTVSTFGTFLGDIIKLVSLLFIYIFY